MKARIAAIALTLMVATGSGVEAADSRLTIGVGQIGLKSHDRYELVVDLEVRGTPWRRLWDIYPTAGVFVTDASSGHLRAGFGRDFAMSDSWRLTITTAAGIYQQGSGPDLGNALEFRSALEVARRFDWGELGLSISHLSNASISEFNPGVEVALVTATIPVGRH